jgi:ribonuclease HI
MLNDQQRLEEAFHVCQEASASGDKEIHVWVAGSRRAGSKIGGWAYRLVIGEDIVHEDAGAIPNITSANRMVLVAVVYGILMAAKRGADSIVVHCACEYICRDGNGGCLRWQQDGWAGVTDSDLWRIVYAIAHEPYRKVGVKVEPRFKVRFEQISSARGNPHFSAARSRSRIAVKSERRRS